MSSNNRSSPQELSPVTLASSFEGRARRGSNASASVASQQTDKEQLAQALDKIHTSSTQCDTLTTFNDLPPPPDSTTQPDNKGFAGELVQNGLSGLYSRFKEAVGVSGKDKSMAPDVTDFQDAASRKTSGTATTTSKGPSASVPRADSGMTSSTTKSTISEPSVSTLPSSNAWTSDGHSQQPQSTKASSVTKSASSSRQTLPNVVHKSGAIVAPVTVNAFKEGSREPSIRVDEPTDRAPDSKRNGGRVSDGPSVTSTPNNSSTHELSDSRYSSALGKLGITNRSRTDDGASIDDNDVVLTSPVKSSDKTPVKSPDLSIAAGPSSSQGYQLPTATSRLSVKDAIRRPAVIDRISGSHTGGTRSRSSSFSTSTAEPTPITTTAHYSVHHESFGPDNQMQRIKSGGYKIPGTTTDEGALEIVNATLEHMRKQVLSKDFWMADETCKECFYCGAPFSAFRRKHHCRTCGCIFDSKCTSIISGQRFGVQGSLRVCKTCLDIIGQRQDENMSDDSADDSYLPAIFRPVPKPAAPSTPNTVTDRDDTSISERTEYVDDDRRSLAAPMMAIPATRRMGGSANRNSAILEIDSPQLSRPSSSRSLRSSAIRPQSSSHRRHQSKHNFLSRFKATQIPLPDERVPFRRSANEEAAKKSGLSAFHDDNVIDPDLAPYMSDESSDDEQMSILQTMAGDEPNSSGLDQDKTNFGSYLGSSRRNRHRPGEKSTSGLSFTSRLDDTVITTFHSRSNRRRNLSTASASGLHLNRSPRPRSSTLKGVLGPAASTETLPFFPGNTPRLTRSSSMKGDKEPKIELNPASYLHVRKLLRQLLQDSAVPHATAWEKALLPILLKCTNSVDPDIERGDDIDIRHYVKIKKIPGSRPSDTSYVPGVIFTKKLALKSMARRLPNPRVMIISFPVEYKRGNQHFMSLQPVIDEEKEYVRNLVSRILAHNPHLLLLENSISGRALQYLSEANVVVAYNVKSSVLSAVSRCLDIPIFSSIDMLSLRSSELDRHRPSKCVGFEVKTYVNDELPGRKKTYIFLSSSQQQLGGTIALRGAPTLVLAKVKRITEFMVYVVYNLKLESCLMQDFHIQLPTSEDGCMNPSQTTESSISSLTSNGRQRTLSTMTSDEVLPSQDSGDGSAATRADVAAPPEPAASQNSQEVNKLVSLHESHARMSNDSLVPEDVPMPTYYSDMVAKYETKILSASPFVKFSQPYLLVRAREQERRLVYLKKLRDHDIVEERADGEKSKPQKFQLIKPQMVHQTSHKAPRQIMEVLHAVHDAEYDKALYNYQTQTKQWENYIQGNLDLFDPYAHQNIVVLHSVVCTETKVPCVEPSLIAIAFYDEHPEEESILDPDCTLGQYVEDVCYSADSLCTASTCGRKMYEHHRTYVHGEARITVFIEYDSNRKSRDKIMMWSYCKICKRETPEVEMSKGTYKYSFAKYLELSFWSRGTRLVNSDVEGGWDCPHELHRDHIRYFGLQDKVVVIHYDPIDLLEIIVPRARITWKVEKDLNLKNEIFTTCQDRWTRFTTSVRTRLKAIKLDNIPIEKFEACKAEIERLTKKVQDEHVSLMRKLQDAYMNSKYYEVIPLNVIVREMLEKVTDWDAAFAKFETDFLPTEKDIRRLTMLQLRKMFTDESKESLSSNDATTETNEGTEETTQTTVTENDSKPDTELIEKDSTQLDAGLEKEPRNEESQQAVFAQADTPTLEKIEPLDLATTGPSAPTKLDPAQQKSEVVSPSAQELLQASLGSPSFQTASAEASATPISSLSVTEQVEQLRRRQHSAVLAVASGPASGNSTSNANTLEVPKVSVPDRVSSRRIGLHISPPLVRALSHPPNHAPAPARSQALSSKKSPGPVKEKVKTPVSENFSDMESRKTPSNENSRSEKKLFSSLRSRNASKSSIPRFVGKKKDSRVSTLAKHFEQLSREFEKERRKDERQRAAKFSHSRAFLQRSSTHAIVEVYEDPDEAAHEPGPTVDDSLETKDSSSKVLEESGTSDESRALEPVPTSDSSPERSKPAEDTTATGAETDEQAHTASQAGTDNEQDDSDTEHSLLEGTIEEIADSIDSSTEIPLELPKQDKMNFMKVLTNFWAERSASEWPALDYPLNATDHIFIDSDIIVREDEPSSLIAFALSCEDYKAKAGKFHGRQSTEVQSGPPDTEKSSSVGGWSDTAAFVGDEALEASFVRATSSHLKYQFNEGSAKMMVKIFYAEQFDALRCRCGVADRIVEALSRCHKFDSKGGKSKSSFLKTQDDRLMMKALSPIETSAFLKFAPSYFSIMAEALFHDLPSVIAKMLGFFQVIIKNPVTNTEIKLDLLLMENLFYDRAPTRIFDLKGSMRNRKIQSTGEQNEVLLDENMVEYIYESPLFAREHSKKLLRASVWNDTLFLARQNVMDYSLMIAVDEAKKELVVGIIDCIRTYTWDKTLESWIKGRGFAGGGRNRPTVTSPKEYKSRFREAMARYILQAPNCWHQFNVPFVRARPFEQASIGAGDEPTETNTDA